MRMIALVIFHYFCLVHAQGSLCPCIGYRRLLRNTSRLRGERSLPMEGERESQLLSLLGPLRLREPWLSLLTSRCLSLSHTHTSYIYTHTLSHTLTHTLHTYFSNIHTHSFSLSHTQTYMHYLSISQTYHIHTLNNMSIGGRESDHRRQWYWYPAIRWQCQIRSRVRLTHTLCSTYIMLHT